MVVSREPPSCQLEGVRTRRLELVGVGCELEQLSGADLGVRVENGPRPCLSEEVRLPAFVVDRHGPTCRQAVEELVRRVVPQFGNRSEHARHHVGGTEERDERSLRERGPDLEVPSEHALLLCELAHLLELRARPTRRNCNLGVASSDAWPLARGGRPRFARPTSRHTERARRPRRDRARPPRPSAGWRIPEQVEVAAARVTGGARRRNPCAHHALRYARRERDERSEHRDAQRSSIPASRRGTGLRSAPMAMAIDGHRSRSSRTSGTRCRRAVITPGRAIVSGCTRREDDVRREGSARHGGSNGELEEGRLPPEERHRLRVLHIEGHDLDAIDFETRGSSPESFRKSRGRRHHRHLVARGHQSPGELVGAGSPASLGGGEVLVEVEDPHGAHHAVRCSGTRTRAIAAEGFGRVMATRYPRVAPEPAVARDGPAARAWIALAQDAVSGTAAGFTGPEAAGEASSSWCSVAEGAGEASSSWCSVAEAAGEASSSWCSVAEAAASSWSWTGWSWSWSWTGWSWSSWSWRGRSWSWSWARVACPSSGWEPTVEGSRTSIRPRHSETPPMSFPTGSWMGSPPRRPRWVPLRYQRSLARGSHRNLGIPRAMSSQSRGPRRLRSRWRAGHHRDHRTARKGACDRSDEDRPDRQHHRHPGRGACAPASGEWLSPVPLSSVTRFPSYGIVMVKLRYTYPTGCPHRQSHAPSSSTPTLEEPEERSHSSTSSTSSQHPTMRSRTSDQPATSHRSTTASDHGCRSPTAPVSLQHCPSRTQQSLQETPANDAPSTGADTDTTGASASDVTLKLRYTYADWVPRIVKATHRHPIRQRRRSRRSKVIASTSSTSSQHPTLPSRTSDQPATPHRSTTASDHGCRSPTAPDVVATLSVADPAITAGEPARRHPQPEPTPTQPVPSASDVTLKLRYTYPDWVPRIVKATHRHPIRQRRRNRRSKVIATTSSTSSQHPTMRSRTSDQPATRTVPPLRQITVVDLQPHRSRCNIVRCRTPRSPQENHPTTHPQPEPTPQP